MINYTHYLNQLGIISPLPVNLATLKHLQKLHLERYAFQCLSSVLHHPISLEEDDIYQKVIVERKGGYCFELNLLLMHLLCHLGFDVQFHSAKIVHNNEPFAKHAYTHGFLLVTLDGQEYVVDIGYGGFNPTEPLRLNTEDVQETEYGNYKITPYEQGYYLAIQQGSEWRILYAFYKCPQYMPDLIVKNWYVSTHPDSPFRTRLIASRIENGLRHNLLNNRYTVHLLNGEKNVTYFSSAEDVLALLERQFLIHITDDIVNDISQFLQKHGLQPE